MKRILDVNELLGPIDMSHNRELENYETSVRHGLAWMYYLQTKPTPLERDRKTSELFEEAIAQIK